MKKLFPIAALLALLVSCEPDNEERDLRSFSFKARIEQPASSSNSKIYLLDERYIYWELGDKISIGSDLNDCEGNKDNTWTARLVDIGSIDGGDHDDFDYFNGVFVTTMEYGSQYFLGLHPQDDRNIIRHSSGNAFNDIRVVLPAVQPLRSDLTFAKQVLPMVAWYGGEWDSDENAFNLDFHSLAGIIRLQVYNETGSAFTLDSIVITSRDNSRQLSGLFRVHGDSYRTEDPWLDATDANTAANRKITLRNTQDGSAAPLGVTLQPAGSGDDSLHVRSFYLVLPAYKSRHDSTTFHLTMTAYSGANTFSRNFSITSRRNGITYLPAVGISEWNPSNTSVVGIVGNGTQQRPFKIYSADDLVKLRDAYNSAVPPAKRYINNIELTNNTYIRIMRTDIVLDAAHWGTFLGGDKGIQNFVGHMSCITNGDSAGIRLKTNVPLFTSIMAGAEVEGITLYGDMEFTVNGTPSSPFCYSNSGTIKDCVVRNIRGKKITATNGPIAGLCATNQPYSTITGCRCEASLRANNGNNVAGICYNNNGTIDGCQGTTLMSIESTGQVGGICFENFANGTIKNTYFATRSIGGSADWGGIVYTNNGTVQHCYNSNISAINTAADKSVGGIVHSQLGGTIDYCWNDASLSAGTVGGIVDTLGGGTIINCYCSSLAQIIVAAASTTHIGAGLVARYGKGDIKNSYVQGTVINSVDGIGLLAGLIGRSSADNTSSVVNCYDDESLSHISATTCNAVFSYCHLVNGSGSLPAGVTAVTPATAALPADNTSGLTYLLNQHIPSNGKTWRLAGSGASARPSLAQPDPSKHRRR